MERPELPRVRHRWPRQGYKTRGQTSSTLGIEEILEFDGVMGFLDRNEGSVREEQTRTSSAADQTNERQGALIAACRMVPSQSYIVTPQLVGDIPGTRPRESILSREERVSCSAIAETGITKGRPRYTDCYAAIPIGDSVMQQGRGRAKCVETWRLADGLSMCACRRYRRDGALGEIGE